MVSLNSWRVSVVLYYVSVLCHSLSGQSHLLRLSGYSLSVSVSELLEYRPKSFSLTKLKMGKQKDLTEEEKSTIVRCLAEGRKSTEIAKELYWDHRTVKRFIVNANQTRKRCDKGAKRKISRRQISDIKREAVKQSLLTSKHAIFEQADVSEIARTTRCRILNTVAKPVKPSIHPPLTTRHRN